LAVALKSDQENAENKGIPGWLYTFPTWLISDSDETAVEPVPSTEETTVGEE
jgi:hypothetical protein